MHPMTSRRWRQSRGQAKSSGRGGSVSLWCGYGKGVRRSHLTPLSVTRLWETPEASCEPPVGVCVCLCESSEKGEIFFNFYLNGDLRRETNFSRLRMFGEKK